MFSAPARVTARLDVQSRMSKLPPWATRLTGFRHERPPPPPVYAVYVWSFIGAFCGLAVLQAIFGHSSYFTGRHVPPIIASFAASAILCYGSIEAPFAQPRALVGGHFLSALIGVCVARIFHLSFSDESNDLQWLAGSLSTAIALVVMHATKTTHPPAGATALLPCIDYNVYRIGWYYLPVILLSSVIVLVTALLINNIQRQYPIFWIYPSPPTSPPRPPPSPKQVMHSDRSVSAPTVLSDHGVGDDTSSLTRSPSMESTCSYGSEMPEKSANTNIIVWMPGRSRWSRAEDKQLMRLMKEGKTIDEIAEQFPGRTPAAVYQRSYMTGDLMEKQSDHAHDR